MNPGISENFGDCCHFLEVCEGRGSGLIDVGERERLRSCAPCVVGVCGLRSNHNVAVC